MGTRQASLLNHDCRVWANRTLQSIAARPNNIGEFVYYIGKTLELMGIACLGAGLYLGCANPFDYSESKAMSVEIGFLILGVLIFFVGRLIEKRS